jgi:hypothetical protein
MRNFTQEFLGLRIFSHRPAVAGGTAAGMEGLIRQGIRRRRHGLQPVSMDHHTIGRLAPQVTAMVRSPRGMASGTLLGRQRSRVVRDVGGINSRDVC